MFAGIQEIGSEQDFYEEYFKSNEFKEFQEKHKDEIIKRYIENPNNKGDILNLVNNSIIVSLKKKILDLYMWNTSNDITSEDELEKRRAELEKEIDGSF